MEHVQPREPGADDHDVELAWFRLPHRRHWSSQRTKRGWQRAKRRGAGGGAPPLRAQAVAAAGSGRTITVSATGMISSTGRSAAAAWARIASGLEAW